MDFAAYNTFPRKKYGKIFVNNRDDIPKVKEIIKAMDEFEFSYLPEELVDMFAPEICQNGSYLVRLAYTHKFDSLDLNELQARCWMAGIHVFCMMNNDDVVWIRQLTEGNNGN